MTKEIWINLPVKDVAASKAFFKSLGGFFRLHPSHESNPNMGAVQAGDHNVMVMLFPEVQIQSYTQNPITDTAKSSEVIFSFSAETREEVDEMAKSVAAAGGNVYMAPGEKDGWMYGCAFADLDGHRWNILYMDMSKMPKG
jgi:predicted lactoylglutathione lyase